MASLLGATRITNEIKDKWKKFKRIEAKKFHCLPQVAEALLELESRPGQAKISSVNPK